MPLVVMCYRARLVVINVLQLRLDNGLVGVFDLEFLLLPPPLLLLLLLKSCRPNSGGSLFNVRPVSANEHR